MKYPRYVINDLSLSCVVFYLRRWGRGHPEEYTEAIALGEEKFDSDVDKKPRAGQILWIRGLTRLQTQVSLNQYYYTIRYLLI